MPVDSKAPKPGMDVASLSDVGLVRENNEDSYLYWEPDSDAEFQRQGRLAIVADGMGGYEGGQEASRLAVETVRQFYEKQFNGDPQRTLVTALESAHTAIQRYGTEHPQLQGMGTTCTAVALIGDRLYFAHIGDSRLYLVRSGTVSRLTRDHSYVGRLVENGIVRSEDAESHPQRHILTAALGSGPEIFPDIPAQPIVLEPADTLILCTDGLWSVVGEAQLATAIDKASPSDACMRLVRLALERGGPDNVTVVVLRVAER